MLLDESEKRRVKGLIINKFRGDKTILDSGIAQLERLAGRSVLGIVPYMDIQLEDEDSVTDRFNARRAADIDIAVIRFPHISNFTDFDIWENVEGVSLRYVSRAYDIGKPDMIILPGTKSTVDDLLWLRESGLEAAVLRQYNDNKCILFGICGGYQMLGEEINDEVSVRGMGLIPMATVFEAEKERTRVEGVFKNVSGVLSCLNGLPICGYEIHMGQSFVKSGGDIINSECYLTELTDNVTGVKKVEGHCGDRVYGSYVHGIFDKSGTVEAIAGALAKRKGIGMPSFHILDYEQHKQQQYDRLADILRGAVDMDKIYRIIESGA